MSHLAGCEFTGVLRELAWPYPCFLVGKEARRALRRRDAVGHTLTLDVRTPQLSTHQL